MTVLKTTSAARTDDRPLLARFREATRELHLSLHEHPLIVELLVHPTLDTYSAVLRAFSRFYQPIEPVLIESARRHKLAKLYPRTDRSDRLTADLRALGRGAAQTGVSYMDQRLRRLDEFEQLLGCLYVVKGSALGGRAILTQLRRHLDVERCCRFFTGDGEQTGQKWHEFQKTCRDESLSESRQQMAIMSARATFVGIAECLTSSMPDERLRPAKRTLA